MFNFQLKSHRLNNDYKQPHFFILNKGLNSGKPLNKPCPNCFVCICNSEEERESLFWITFALSEGLQFRELLIGSVIPFIRIKDAKNVLQLGIERSRKNNKIFFSGIGLLKEIATKDAKHKEITKTLGKLKYALVRDILR